MSDKDLDFELIGMEYKRTALLKQFSILCKDMKNEKQFSNKIRNFYRQTPDAVTTTKNIFLKEYDYILCDDDANVVSIWIKAFLKKKPSRITISDEIKEALTKKQNGKCAICGKQLGSDFSEIHVDHIIPWNLVGDELENNYQNLCKECNLKKSNQVDYMLKKAIGLV